mmetsp:Transcript_101949/g.287744  ORF Transcript_101949/g.287744 Transcript_101949/m.287744 type:complete len:293 (+) Transcript_101949:337-1215(+)
MVRSVGSGVRGAGPPVAARRTCNCPCVSSRMYASYSGVAFVPATALRRFCVRLRQSSSVASGLASGGRSTDVAPATAPARSVKEMLAVETATVVELPAPEATRNGELPIAPSEPLASVFVGGALAPNESPSGPSASLPRFAVKAATLRLPVIRRLGAARGGVSCDGAVRMGACTSFGLLDLEPPPRRVDVEAVGAPLPADQEPKNPSSGNDAACTSIGLLGPEPIPPRVDAKAVGAPLIADPEPKNPSSKADAASELASEPCARNERPSPAMRLRRPQFGVLPSASACGAPW